MDTFSKHIPELNSLGGKARIAIYAVGQFLLITAYFVITDQIPTWSIDSQIIITSLGFLVMSLFFSRKQAFIDKYGKSAYRRAFTYYTIPGLSLTMAAIVHSGYMNGPSIPDGWWKIFFFAFGWYTLCIGTLLWIRSIFAFGVDNLASLYVYHPENSKFINSSIYSILRHPIYAGVMRIIIGLALINGNANAIAFAILIPLGFASWVLLIEEKELINRCGLPYLEYRQSVPAFFPKLRDLGTFFNFLLTGK